MTDVKQIIKRALNEGWSCERAAKELERIGCTMDEISEIMLSAIMEKDE